MDGLSCLFSLSRFPHVFLIPILSWEYILLYMNNGAWLGRVREAVSTTCTFALRSFVLKYVVHKTSDFDILSPHEVNFAWQTHVPTVQCILKKHVWKCKQMGANITNASNRNRVHIAVHQQKKRFFNEAVKSPTRLLHKLARYPCLMQPPT